MDHQFDYNKFELYLLRRIAGSNSISAGFECQEGPPEWLLKISLELVERSCWNNFYVFKLFAMSHKECHLRFFLYTKMFAEAQDKS